MMVTVYGGPMYYLRDGLKDRRDESFGKVLAVLFAILCVGASFWWRKYVSG